MQKTFALIGAAGYVAPRHMQAIKDCGGKLVSALDPHDSVGVLDSFSPNCLYFKEPERFDRWLSRNSVDYVVVCSPNYLHDSHCLMAMRNGADVICEKPLCLNERNIDNLSDWEHKTGQKINVILQCRLHDNVVSVVDNYRDGFHTVRVNYRTPRGKWYFRSWKGDVERSGGIATNIGIHLFDLCVYLFGSYVDNGGIEQTTRLDETTASGAFELEHAIVSWNLSIEQGHKMRSFDVGLSSIDLVDGFENLHTKSYKNILDGSGFGIDDIRQATMICERIRNCKR